MSAGYGDCPCGGRYEHRTVEVNMRVDGEQIKLEQVGQGNCPTCGGRVYKAGELEEIEALMGDRGARALQSPR